MPVCTRCLRRRWVASRAMVALTCRHSLTGCAPRDCRPGPFRCASSGWISVVSRTTCRQTCNLDSRTTDVNERFQFQLDNRLIYGVGRSRELAAFLAERGMRRVLITVDEGVAQHSA